MKYYEFNLLSLPVCLLEKINQVENSVSASCQFDKKKSGWNSTGNGWSVSAVTLLI